MLASITEFFGHFHPLLVHLPIGFLLAALLLQWLSAREKYGALRPAMPVILFWGAVAATISAVTGYLLSISDDYDKGLVGWHQWMGIGVALISWLLYAKQKGLKFPVNQAFLGVVLFILILITGHLGGSLTHGSDYLTKPLSGIFAGDSTSIAAIKPVPDVQEALAFNDIIKPILQTKCFSCHGPNKQKGKLRMDNEQLLMKGGKDGKVIEAGNADQSEMIKRLLLPVDNEDHMPPKEKPQPTEAQIALLHWWISTGADFGKKVKDLPQPDRLKPVLAALQTAQATKSEVTFIPAGIVDKADETAIGQLKERGIVVLPVAQNSNWLLADFVTHSNVDTADLRRLLVLKKQLIWLRLRDASIVDTDMSTIGQFANLTKLSLDHTSISDTGIVLLSTLSNLVYLNLVGTKVTARGILQLKDLKMLRSLYLYQTGIRSTDWPALKNAFPRTVIDTGGYRVETLPTDTTVVKAKQY